MKYVKGDLLELFESGEFDVIVRRFNAEQNRNATAIAASPDLLEAARDALAGWRYIRETHGDLYGVGWDRVEEKLKTALLKAGCEL